MGEQLTVRVLWSPGGRLCSKGSGKGVTLTCQRPVAIDALDGSVKVKTDLCQGSYRPRTWLLSVSHDSLAVKA